MIDERRLDLSLLDRALVQLRHALDAYADHPQTEAFRDSVVMRFVFSYELCVQVLRRFVQLEHLRPLPEDELRTPRVIRRANALKILRPEWEEFAAFRDARNAVAHTYSEAKAVAVAALAARFAEEAQYVLDQVRSKLND